MRVPSFTALNVLVECTFLRHTLFGGTAHGPAALTCAKTRRKQGPTFVHMQQIGLNAYPGPLKFSTCCVRPISAALQTSASADVWGMYARRAPGACPAHYLCIKYPISSPKFILT